jgi:hypothetical protein
MSSDITSTRGNTAAIVGDACLFTTAAFCLLAVVGGPLALLIGPAVAWSLHERRIDRTAVIGGVVGIAVGLVAVGGLFALVSLVSGAIGPVGGWEFTVPVALLATAGAVFLALLVALDIDSLRDLSPARRKHTRLDLARLASTLVVAVFMVVVSLLQSAHPESEIGDAGVFALGAGAVGALTMLVANAIYVRSERRNGTAGTAAST